MKIPKKILKGIDKDFKPLIEELNRVGLKTLFSCCGHGEVDKHGFPTNAYLVLDASDLIIMTKNNTIAIHWKYDMDESNPSYHTKENLNQEVINTFEERK